MTDDYAIDGIDFNCNEAEKLHERIERLRKMNTEKKMTPIKESNMNEWIINLHQDGNAFIALIGENLQEGIVGVGDTPREALIDLANQEYFSS